MCKAKAGFTLVELLVVTAILAVTLVGMVQVFIQCDTLANIAAMKTLAMSEAQKKLEEIRNTDFDSIMSTFSMTCICGDGLDNDGDGAIDYDADAQCLSSWDNTEETLSECADGTDNDGDGLTDYPNDPECLSPFDNHETDTFKGSSGGVVECADGIDNDGDGSIDFPSDSDCISANDADEGSSVSQKDCYGTFIPGDFDGAGTIYMNVNGWDDPLSMTQPNFLEVVVVISWEGSFGRIIGEDTNLNGVLNSGEDTNGSGLLDSPVSVMDIITKR